MPFECALGADDAKERSISIDLARSGFNSAGRKALCCVRHATQRGAPPPTHTMPTASGPDLKKYMDKRLSIKLNGNRTVVGFLRGFDQFMNLVLDESVEMVRASRKKQQQLLLTPWRDSSRALPKINLACPLQNARH